MSSNPNHTELLKDEKFSQYLIDEFVKEKEKNPSASLEKFIPIARKTYLSTKMCSNFSLELMANSRKTKSTPSPV
jgi:hypothetical protein